MCMLRGSLLAPSMAVALVLSILTNPAFGLGAKKPSFSVWRAILAPQELSDDPLGSRSGALQRRSFMLPEGDTHSSNSRSPPIGDPNRCAGFRCIGLMRVLSGVVEAGR